MYTRDDEPTIYGLIPEAEIKREKAPRHVSKFRDDAKGDYVKLKDDHKTMGQAKVPVRQPESFMKKHEKEPVLPDRRTFKYPDEERKRPPVPTTKEQPLMGLKTSKNFITNNAVQNITSVPRMPQKVYVDTRGGHKNLLEPSGLEPVYVHRKDYGETPKYLEKRKDEMKRAQEEYDAYIAEHFRRGAMRSLSGDERQAILQGLKTNWEEIHDQYQGLSVVTDTAPKKNRKERMEAEMKQLERDIETIERHNVIYIGN
ncbi:enkurin-like [Mytilus galloprovincialis]|uniref:Enkurin n=3 Tax=Mytilus TaxID=6548 RepID=N0E3R7_MYTGA|nr:enkurin [Mytilus edulis]CCI39202.1 enkurin [Mytilus galloprovincialis]CCI39192.1 enkurin [Mytilus edulis]CCI39193.1 enkurin [Mytilus edulis]CCI39194.1 enkurin [Mytilus edulis]